MPPRYAYWTILIDGAATAFRAKERDELLPTFNQLKRKNDDVALRYFAQGKLWDSPEQADWARRNKSEFRDRRTAAWRPGGTHTDPRSRAREDKGRRAGNAKRDERPLPKPRTPDFIPADRQPSESKAAPDSRKDRWQGPADRNRFTERDPSRTSPPREHASQRQADAHSSQPRDSRKPGFAGRESKDREFKNRDFKDRGFKGREFKDREFKSRDSSGGGAKGGEFKHRDSGTRDLRKRDFKEREPKRDVNRGSQTDWRPTDTRRESRGGDWSRKPHDRQQQGSSHRGQDAREGWRHQQPPGGPASARSHGDRSSDRGGSDRRPSGGHVDQEHRGGHHPHEKPFGKRPFEKRAFGKRPFEKRAFDDRPSDKRPFEKRAFDNRPAGQQPFEKRPSDKRPFGKRPFEGRPFGGGREDRRPFDQPKGASDASGREGGPAKPADRRPLPDRDSAHRDDRWSKGGQRPPAREPRSSGRDWRDRPDTAKAKPWSNGSQQRGRFDRGPAKREQPPRGGADSGRARSPRNEKPPDDSSEE